MTSTPKGIIAVTDQVPNAGAVVWWRLSGTVDHAELCETWRAANLPETLVPRQVAPSTALARAVEELREKHRLVRTLPKGGHAVVDELYVNGEPSYNVVATIKLTDGDTGVPSPTIEGPRAEELASQVRAAFFNHYASLATVDISVWLATVVRHLRAVSLRDKGGIYFVPTGVVAEWHKVVQVLREVSTHFLAEIPAMRSEEAVSAILDAVQREADGEISAMSSELAAGALKKRALENRTDRCVALDDKISAYEALLGRHLDTLRERVEEVRARMTAAILELDIAKEDESHAA